MGKNLAAFLLAACTCHAAFGQSPAAARRPTAHLVSCIDVKDFGAETVRIGDLDGDGGPDLLFVQSHFGSRASSDLPLSLPPK